MYVERTMFKLLMLGVWILSLGVVAVSCMHLVQSVSSVLSPHSLLLQRGGVEIYLTYFYQISSSLGWILISFGAVYWLPKAMRRIFPEVDA